MVRAFLEHMHPGAQACAATESVSIRMMLTFVQSIVDPVETAFAAFMRSNPVSHYAPWTVCRSAVTENAREVRGWSSASSIAEGAGIPFVASMKLR